MMPVLALCADLTTSLSLSDWTELRLRAVEVPQGGGPSTPPTVAFDLAMTPDALLETHSRRVYLGVDYAPGLTVSLSPTPNHSGGARSGLELGDGRDLEILHTARTKAAWRGRNVQLVAGEEASYGELNYTYLDAHEGSDTARQFVPGRVVLRAGSSRTSLSMLETTRRLSLSLMPSLQIAGGLDETSRASLPVQSTERVDASLTYAATRRDWLGPTVAVWTTRSTPRPCDAGSIGVPRAEPGTPPTCANRIEGADEQLTYGRRLSRRALLSSAAGAAVVRRRVNAEAPAHVTTYPEASLGLQVNLVKAEPVSKPAGQNEIERWFRRAKADRTDALALAFEARLAPVIDMRYVEPDQRASASIGASWRHARMQTIASVTGDRSVPPTTISATAVGAATSFLWTLDPRFDAGGGVRGGWQHEPALGSFFSVVVSAVFVWREPPIVL